jgi:hypothetical protein
MMIARKEDIISVEFRDADHVMGDRER